jgi:hypothetical protein
MLIEVLLQLRLVGMVKRSCIGTAAKLAVQVSSCCHASTGA